MQTGRALVEAGLHPASGGDGSFACSGDMLLVLTERYCVVFQTLAVPPELGATVVRAAR